MPRYRFTHPFAEVFSDLTHGAGTIVQRVIETDDPLGSTVVLQPGDELTTKKKYPHAHLTTIKPDGSEESDETDTSDDQDETPSEESGEPSEETPAETTTDEVKE